MHAAAVGRRPSALTSASRRSLVSTRESLSVGRRSAKELTRRSARTPRRNVGSLIKFFDPSSSQPRDQPTEQPEEQPVEPPPVFVVPADLDALPPRDTMTDFFSPVPTEPDYLSMFAADAKADEGRVPWWRAPHIAWLLLFFGWLVITAAAVQAPELSLEIWQGQQRVLDLNNIRERLQLPTIRDPWRQATSYVDAASLDAKWQAATFQDNTGVAAEQGSGGPVEDPCLAASTVKFLLNEFDALNQAEVDKGLQVCVAVHAHTPMRMHVRV